MNRIVCCELVWVLQRCYGYSREQIGDVLERLLRTRQISVEDLPGTWKALGEYRSGKADFADALIAATNRERGCGETVTFDRVAGTLDGMRLLKV